MIPAQPHRTITFSWAIIAVLMLIALLINPAIASEPAEITDVQVSNLRDVSASISWLTQDYVTGEVHYGTSPASLLDVQPDDRGVMTSSTVHHVTLVHLLPDTTYYFYVKSDGEIDDNGGANYQFRTGPILDLPRNDTVWGQVLEHDGVTPAADVLVFLQILDADGAGSPGRSTLMSGLTDDTGYWHDVATGGAINLAGTRTTGGTSYFRYSQAGDFIQITAKRSADVSIEIEADTANDSPAPPIILPDTGDHNTTFLPLLLRQ